MLKEVFKKRRHLDFLVDISDIEKVLKVLQEYGLAESTIPTNLRIGNCGWAKAPNCYYVSLIIPLEEVENVVKSMRESNITFLPESTTGF